jgi:D-alanyl-lipoteichoic acid acyltransferase DltB (MBOAT superfamily)
MLFNSLSFLLFFPTVYLIYWYLQNKDNKKQNIFLLLSSYFFYGCWDWRFLFLLLFSTGLDYFSGIKMENTQHALHKKVWLWVSIGINLGFLGIFKYYNFFAESMQMGLAAVGISVSPIFLNIVLPVGISFYTFHGLSYVIDVYYGRIRAERNVVDYSLFVSFFPLLVAGPIERATHLLPQIKKPRVFNYAQSVDGLRQILWGMFKKVVIADGCAFFANEVFNNSLNHNGSAHILGAFFFSIQIYGDFSGYSDIALGTARLLGFDLLKNFSFPYFSRDIAEFWRRWHISLSSWFKDYVYIPLGGSQGGLFNKIRNTFIIFLLSGFWHGANWTFIFWGGLNALFFIPLLLMGKNRNYTKSIAWSSNWKDNLSTIMSIGITFGLTTFAWIFFRAASLSDAFQFIQNCFSASVLVLPSFNEKKYLTLMLFFILILFVAEWRGRHQNHALESFDSPPWNRIRYVIYYLLMASILFFMGKAQNFIYFQF